MVKSLTLFAVNTGILTRWFTCIFTNFGDADSPLSACSLITLVTVSHSEQHHRRSANLECSTMYCRAHFFSWPSISCWANVSSFSHSWRSSLFDSRFAVYAVSFLATLNTRTLVRGRGTDQEDPHHRGDTFYMYGQSANSRMQGTGQLASPSDELQMKVCIFAVDLWRALN